MDATHKPESQSEVADLLVYLRQKGVRLRSKNGNLHCEAPKGAVTLEEIELIRGAKDELIALLTTISAGGISLLACEPSPRRDRAPLAYSQLAWWQLHKLGARNSSRSIASAICLRGRLNVDALTRGCEVIVRRHDALRTRILVCDGLPMQVIDEPAGWTLRVVDLTTVTQQRRDYEIAGRIEKLIAEPIDLAVGPLFAVELSRLSNDEHVLIVSMDHIISDGYSLSVLLREIFEAYVQILNGGTVCLPGIPTQFIDYAQWQRNSAREWIEEHGSYWSEHLKGCGRVKFPEDRGLSSITQTGWGQVRVTLKSSLRAQLSEWCRVRKTTLVMGVFTAYAALVLRWCNNPEAVIQYQSDGRIGAKLENAIGFYSSRLYLRTQLFHHDSFNSLLKRITDEYCAAYEHVDFYYLEAQVNHPEFAHNTLFNWAPEGSSGIDLSCLLGSDNSLTICPIPFLNPWLRDLDWDNEPTILLSDLGDEVVGGVYFPMNRFSDATMARFARNFLVFIEEQLRHPEGRISDISLD